MASQASSPMTQSIVPRRLLASVGAPPGQLPSLFLRSEDGGKRFWEFFTANIRNKNTRKAYFVAVSQFARWCEGKKLRLEDIQPIHVAGYIELLCKAVAKPPVKQHLAAIRMLFDWLVTGQVVPINPAHAVRGPKHSVKKGKTSVLSAEEMELLLKSIKLQDKKGHPVLIGFRDSRAHRPDGLHLCQGGAVINMKVEGYYIQKRRGWVRLSEKGGKVNELPCHHNLEGFLDEWLKLSGLAFEPTSPLFPTMRHGKLTDRTPLAQANVYMMIQRRVREAGITTKTSCHTFQATPRGGALTGRGWPLQFQDLRARQAHP